MTENKTKVLLCSPGNANAKVGGISRWTGHLMDYYKVNQGSCNIDIHHYYCTCKKHMYADTPIFTRCITGIKVYLSLYRGFCNIVRNQKFDVVHFCSSASISLAKDILLLNAAKRRGIKTVIHFRFGRIPELYRNKNWEQKLLHKIIKLADRVVVIDETSYKTLINNGYSNIYLLPNPLSPKVNEIIANNSNIIRIERKILFAGHVVPTKGVFELVEACKSIPNIHLKMIGFVSDEMKLKLIESAGINNEWLNIVGEKDYDTIIKEMLSSGVFVFPSYTEGFPNVIIESMACGCPIVASSVGAIPEMLDTKGEKKSGICIEAKNVGELKDAITKMVEDRNYALQYGKNAQNRVNDVYSMPVIWKELCRIWEEAVIT